MGKRDNFFRLLRGKVLPQVPQGEFSLYGFDRWQAGDE